MFTIRKATAQDVERIHFLASQVFPATYRDILSPEQLDYMFEWMYAPAHICRQMDEGQVYMILSKAGEDCGYASVERQGEKLFHLQKIYVLPAFQGCRAGRFLFEEVVKHIREVCPVPCVLELNVNRRNEAFHFYRRMGMFVDREGDFPIGNGYYMNDYIMKMEID
ncbi:MAG: GNAT family N-acetyltransferase [Prevotellaceae bacterium]|jgi:ribosomal protein S18 acetylase RimI-like enzyme|nr:GNAT family N-acetyltransferase [Prevotellaceae bacterium]